MTVADGSNHKKYLNSLCEQNAPCNIVNNVIYSVTACKILPTFLGAFTKLRKATITFVTFRSSFRPSVRTHRPLEGFS
jgi:hypothetical protein